MKKISIRIILACNLLILIGLSIIASGQIRTSQQPPDVERIIREFTAKESEFKEARNSYAYRQEFRVQTINPNNRPTGEYYRVADVTFDDSGKHTERIVRFPPPTLLNLQISPTDLKDVAEIQTFSLTTKELPKYLITYIGKEKIDELDTYVFEVKPKSIPKYKRGGERVFLGRIWVDDQDLQIVKVSGKGLPEGEERFPKFETYRENIDGKYWFPTYTFADDILDFPGNPIHMRMEVRYTNYKKFSSDVKILSGDED
ncbi:MAG: hypothetical protein HY819_17705 [Acidobacteria bacterium]|nr:hypothetical protein [Acidobacteriota bacterium]